MTHYLQNPQLPDWATLRLVMPEIWLILGMCAVIIVPFATGRSRRMVVPAVAAAAAAIVASLVSVLLAMTHLDAGDGGVFSGMLTIDPFSQFFKLALLVFVGMILYQWWLVGRDGLDAVETPDFLCLLLGAAVGMMLMASASNLLMIVIAIESASLPSYVLAGLHKRQLRGSEGSLKYVIFGAAATTIAVYGLSLVYGATGTLDLHGVAHAAAAVDAGGAPALLASPLLAAGLVGMLAGIAFKLSAVPVHFWCPDVFEAAPFEVTTFLSVASKGAAVCLLLRVLGAFGAAGAAGQVDFTLLMIVVAAIGAVTATWGNVVAIQQDNIKRLLAYSSIAHAGYMIMAASCAALLSGAEAGRVAWSLLFYIVVYLFMNTGAFTVGALIAQSKGGSEDVRTYAGLIRRAPGLTALMGVFLLSLFGMPGLGGFLGKVYIGLSMIQLGTFGFVLVGVLLVNTVISLFVYLRPVYYMVLAGGEGEGDEQAEPKPRIAIGSAAMGLLGICVLGLVWTGLELGGPSEMIRPFGVIRGTVPSGAGVSPASSGGVGVPGGVGVSPAIDPEGRALRVRNEPRP